MLTIRKAGAADVESVYTILRAAASDLHARGYDQWPADSPNLQRDRLGAQVGRGEFWIVRDGGRDVAVGALSLDGDPDFWEPGELAQPAGYLSKGSVLPEMRGRGIGAMLARWRVDRACQLGARWARLDAWRTNTDLHAYYRRQGWQDRGIVARPGRRSGARFERPARPDLEARRFFPMSEPSAETPRPAFPR